MGVIKSIEHVSTTVSSASTAVLSHALTLGQDEAMCVPFHSIRSDSSQSETSIFNHELEVYLDNSGGPRVNFLRRLVSTATTLGVECDVVEFHSSFVNLQQGTFSQAAGTSASTATITSVNQAKSFVVSNWSPSSVDAAHDSDFDDNFITLSFGSNTSIKIDRRAASSVTIEGRYYVVESIGTDFATQFVSPLMSSASSASSAAITAVDTTASFMFGQYRADEAGDDPRDGMCYFELESSVSVSMRKPSGIAGTAQIDGAIWVVESGGAEFSVQHQAPDITGSTTVSDTITAVATTRAIVVHNNSVGQSQITSTSGSGWHIRWFQTALRLTSSVAVELRRLHNTDVNYRTRYQVIEFELASTGAAPAAVLPTLTLLGVGT